MSADDKHDYDKLAREMMQSWQRAWRDQWGHDLSANAGPAAKSGAESGARQDPIMGWMQAAQEANQAMWAEMNRAKAERAETADDKSAKMGENAGDEQEEATKRQNPFSAFSFGGNPDHADARAHRASPEAANPAPNPTTDSTTGATADAAADATPSPTNGAASVASDAAITELARRVSELELRVEQLSAELQIYKNS